MHACFVRKKYYTRQTVQLAHPFHCAAIRLFPTLLSLNVVYALPIRRDQKANISRLPQIASHVNIPSFALPSLRNGGYRHATYRSVNSDVQPAMGHGKELKAFSGEGRRLGGRERQNTGKPWIQLEMAGDATMAPWVQTDLAEGMYNDGTLGPVRGLDVVPLAANNRYSSAG